MSEATTTGLKDVDEVLEALRAVVAEFGPDHVYVNEAGEVANGTTLCRYVHGREGDNPQPGCIVGQVFYRLFGTLVPIEGVGVPGLNYGPRDGYRYFTESAERVLAAAQAVQDLGWTWGAALARAETVAKGRA